MSQEPDAKSIAFAETQWSLVRRAGQASAQTRHVSLGTLLQRYLPALRAHLTIDKKLPVDRAEDLLQGFVADKVVEQNLVALADPARGKFRSFLLVALNRYATDQFRREGAAMRGGQAGGTSPQRDPNELISPQAQPSDQFDLVWARELVARALQLMSGECQETGRGEIWEVFDCRVVRPAFEGVGPMPYDALIQKYGLQTPIQTYNLLTTAKRMFTRCLHAAAAEYAGSDGTAEQEITDLKTILARFGA